MTLTLACAECGTNLVGDGTVCAECGPVTGSLPQAPPPPSPFCRFCGLGWKPLDDHGRCPDC